MKKKLFKPYQIVCCEICNKPLDLSELAFYEIMCTQCHSNANTVIRSFIEPFINNLKTKQP